jgi:hypothetical protein
LLHFARAKVKTHHVRGSEFFDDFNVVATNVRMIPNFRSGLLPVHDGCHKPTRTQAGRRHPCKPSRDAGFLVHVEALSFLP